MKTFTGVVDSFDDLVQPLPEKVKGVKVPNLGFQQKFWGAERAVFFWGGSFGNISSSFFLWFDVVLAKNTQ